MSKLLHHTLGGMIMLALLGSAASAPVFAGEPKKGRVALEKAFAEKMSGATLVGSFTVDGRNKAKPPRPERYELGKVFKAREDYWTFHAKMKYGEKQQTIEIPVTVKMLWAGDTPVITLDDLTIPGLGTFTARVLFHGDRYVGTWQHGKVGGHMFGRIESNSRRDGDKDTSDREKASPVSGTVTLDGKPLANATIEFIPDDGQGRPVRGRTDADGRFQVDVVPGEKRVSIDIRHPETGRSLLPARYNRRTALKVRVPAGGRNVLDFDLRSR